MSSTSSTTETPPVRKRRRLRGLAAVATVVGVLGVVAPAANADVTAPNGGHGDVSAQCSQISQKITVQITQQQQNGRLGQSMWTDIGIYAYSTGKVYPARSGWHSQLANSGLGYTWYTSPALPHGRYAVRVTYRWYTTAGWIAGTEWAHQYRQQTPYYVYGGGYTSGACYV